MLHRHLQPFLASRCGDGFPDIVFADWEAKPSIQFKLGDGKGGFRSGQNYLKGIVKSRASYMEVEVPDINNDGRFDLVLAGYENHKQSKYRAETLIVLNKSEVGFEAGEVIRIPQLRGFGEIGDVITTIQGNGKVLLWLLRGGKNEDQCLQKFNPNTKETAIYQCVKGADIKRLYHWMEAGVLNIGGNGFMPKSKRYLIDGE